MARIKDDEKKFMVWYKVAKVGKKKGDMKAVEDALNYMLSYVTKR